MKRRNDATYVADLDPYRRALPYVMNRRVDSFVFHQLTIDLTRGVQFIKELNRDQPGDHQYRVFELFLAALLRTIVMRPQLNRFWSNYDCWQRNDLSLNFVVKEDYTDEALEHSAVLNFEPTMIFPEIATIINRTIENVRNEGKDNGTDDAIDFFLSFPKLLLRFILRIVKFLDRHGIAPKALRDADGLHTSAFIANLGSIGLTDSLHHHLFEWGTTSIFITMGMMKRKRVFDEHNQRSFVDTMQIGVSLDERISDGFYFIKSIQVLQDYLKNPEKLMERPELPPPGPSEKEVKIRRRAERRARKQQ
ncbi:MAG: 2-oxoacid:acceptor oxidoreductase [Spirochaetae bacterium HGW-Spirochaetae-8]|nr:MAG: 2-oxoacid:acceptor oxidoreductase [Spirochaetae bacterium HGW-Spirochaetae-8]